MRGKGRGGEEAVKTHTLLFIFVATNLRTRRNHAFYLLWLLVVLLKLIRGHMLSVGGMGGVGALGVRCGRYRRPFCDC